MRQREQRTPTRGDRGDRAQAVNAEAGHTKKGAWQEARAPVGGRELSLDGGSAVAHRHEARRGPIVGNRHRYLVGERVSQPLRRLRVVRKVEPVGFEGRRYPQLLVEAASWTSLSSSTMLPPPDARRD